MFAMSLGSMVRELFGESPRKDVIHEKLRFLQIYLPLRNLSILYPDRPNVLRFYNVEMLNLRSK